MKSLDDDILTSLAMLRRRINPLQSPIYRLPSDVFSEVASHLQPETDLTRFTHVSYHLRAILLSCPSLWSCIDTSHEEQAREFLQRSKQTPLRVNLFKLHDCQEFSLLPSQIARLVSLQLCNCASQKESTLSQPMPALTRLEIHGTTYYHYDDGGAENLPLRSLISVTSLVVKSIGFIPLRVPHLTRFEFKDEDGETMINPLLDFLDNCPLLEDLYIYYISESSNPPRDRLASLPNLRNYTQHMYDDHYSLGLFNMLSLSPTCSVTLRRDIQFSDVVAADVVPPFQNPDHLDGITRIKLRARDYYISDGTTMTLELINAKGAKVCLEKIGCESPGGLIPLDESKLAHMRCLPDFNPRSVGILCLEGYDLQDDPEQFVDHIRNTLGCSPSLTTIILSFTTVKPCLLALDIDPDADNHPRHSSSVHTLVIHSDPYPFDRPDTQTLLAVAQRRKAAGCPFKSVSLFLLEDLQPGRILDELRECIEGFEVTVRDKAPGWDVDRYFLAGLDHLQECRDVWCD